MKLLGNNMFDNYIIEKRQYIITLFKSTIEAVDGTYL